MWVDFHQEKLKGNPTQHTYGACNQTLFLCLYKSCKRTLYRFIMLSTR